ncbi:unnamed protein product, partial [marine sediment metagenome]
KEIILPQEIEGNYSGWHIYIIKTAKIVDRDKLVKFLKDNGVAVNFHYPAIYSHPYYQVLGYGKIKLQNMEEYHNSCITLPCFSDLSQKNIKYIGKMIKKFF